VILNLLVILLRRFIITLLFTFISLLPTGLCSDDDAFRNTGTIPRLNFSGLCLEDSPLGVRFADFVSAFPVGINAASTWDKHLIHARGVAMVRFYSFASFSLSFQV
jgi:beta-glucosidase